ncbi:MAG TPA: hypothetical protein V6D22_25625 [Candidatus Obscuribacterales bacterium]
MIAGRFADFGMQCEFNPRFALNPAKDAGLVEARLSMPGLSQYGDVEMLSSFEISFKDFRYASPLSVDPKANEKLKACTAVVTVRMHATPTSAVRVGLFFAAFLAELTDGILYTPRSDNYFQATQALEHVLQEVAAYETQLLPEDWSIAPFISWPNGK